MAFREISKLLNSAAAQNVIAFVLLVILASVKSYVVNSVCNSLRNSFSSRKG